MLGSHLSIAGGMVNALHEAQQLGMDCVQVFTKNQRQWRASELSDQQRRAWLQELQRMGWDSLQPNGKKRPPGRVVAHSSYLINLAQPNKKLWQKSLAAQRIEIERCEALNIPCSVVHPGAHLTGEPRLPNCANDLSETCSRAESAGLKRIAKALNQIHRDLPGYRTITCLETTVGSGTNLGYSFHQLACIRSLVKHPERVGFCLDTCHVTAAGYDMSTQAKAHAVLQEWDEICGFQTLRVFHLNDSVKPCGSRRDRHAHIGAGCCGRSCFQVILNHPAFRTVPKLLETPKGVNDKGVKWDLVNLRRLRRMMEKAV
ncbi:MAG: deoxyribonuclease IV [Phycisphaerales bacterium]|nr:deoxyribonuclease IV [Phycisphaerales bacterium]MCI0675042.1 deoxyribonuclease IV [Phycisphaerales bacterium]